MVKIWDPLKNSKKNSDPLNFRAKHFRPLKICSGRLYPVKNVRPLNVEKNSQVDQDQEGKYNLRWPRLQKICSYAYRFLHPSSQEKHTNITKKVAIGKIVIRQQQKQRKCIDTIS